MPLPALAPLRHRPFRLLISGRFAAATANTVTPIALAFAVLDLTGSALDLGLVVGARSAMILVFMLAGGVIADRVPRRVVLFWSSLAAAASQLAVAVIVFTGSASMAVLVGLAAVNGFASALGFPAGQALLPQTVPGSDRQAANALNRLIIQSAMISGAAGGGIAVGLIGPGGGLVASAALSGLAAALYLPIRVADVRSGRSPAGVLADLRDGWMEISSRPAILAVVICFAFYNLAYAGAIQVIGPIVADQTVGRAAWGVVLAAQTAGMVLGALIALRIRVQRLLGLGVLCMVGQLPFIAILGVAPNFPALLVSAVLAGIAVEIFIVSWDTTLQGTIPPDRLARVYSYDAAMSYLAIPVGLVVAGPLALAIGAPAALLAAAGVCAVSLAATLSNRSVRIARQPVDADQGGSVTSKMP